MMKNLFCTCLLLSSLFYMVGCGDPNSSTNLDNEGSSASKTTDDEEDQDNSSGSSKKSSSSTSGSSSSKYQIKTKLDSVSIKKGTFIDERDGQEYKYVTLGKQTWMAENLNYETESGSWCVGQGKNGCKKYGRAYTWEALLDMPNSHCDPDVKCEFPFQGVCPVGWHVPTSDEWDTLFVTTGQKRPDDGKYKGISYLYLAQENCHYCGTDDYGFSIVTNKDSLSRLTLFHVSNNFNYENIYYIYGYRRGVYVEIDNYDVSIYGTDRATAPPRMVRCIKDEIERPDINKPETIKSTAKGCENAVWKPRVQPCNDLKTDNCVYQSGGVKIGEKYWRVGATNTTPYYNGATCGDGWYVADTLDWANLFEDIGGICFASLMLKSSSGWDAGNGINAYGLNIKPTGHYDVWVDHQKKTARLDYREFNDERSDAGFFVYAKDQAYRQAYIFNSTHDVYLSSRTSYSGNLLCVKGYRDDDKQEAEKTVLINPNFDYGEFTDPRDNQVYKTTVIGPQKWMAQNLRYETKKSITVDGKIYGQHYTYEDALEACPAGWHLPSKAEFDTLIYNGARGNYSSNLLSKDESSYYSDATGFSLGLIASDDYPRPHVTTSLWSSTKVTDSTAIAFYVYHSGATDTLYTPEFRMRQYKSIRCLNDTSLAYGFSGTYGSFEDPRDGKTYKTIEINGATWMAENLNFESGNSFCYLDSCDVYGRHYQFPFTSVLYETLCPDGWHISTAKDWVALFAATYDKDSTTTSLKKMYAWPPRYQGKDTYGFGLIPNECYGEYRSGERNSACLGVEDTENKTGFYYDFYGSDFRENRISDDKYAYGIRCVKDPE